MCNLSSKASGSLGITTVVPIPWPSYWLLSFHILLSKFFHFQPRLDFGTASAGLLFCLSALVSGRPRRSWLQQVEEDVGLSVGAAWIAGQDRSMWRTLRPSAGQAQQWVSEWCVACAGGCISKVYNTIVHNKTFLCYRIVWWCEIVNATELPKPVVTNKKSRIYITEYETQL